MIKTAIAYANTDGGFIVFGVDPRGQWVGLTLEALEAMDVAHLTELINSCVSPDLPVINYAEVEVGSRRFTILHVPPSRLMPHVTTKEVFEEEAGKRRVSLLSRWAVYCRQGGRTNLATPAHYERIIDRRTSFLKTELLRRVREVEVPRAHGRTSSGGMTTVQLVKATKDPGAPAVRLTRNPEEAASVYLHEEISDGLFDEINNVLRANSQLAGSQRTFLLGPAIYYRIYAERQHVKQPIEELEVLARTGLIELYAPVIYWLLRLPAERSGRIVRELFERPKAPNIRTLVRIAVLLGPEVFEWLRHQWDARWGKDSQPPDYYWLVEKIGGRAGVEDRRLLALRMSDSSEIELATREGQIDRMTLADLLRGPQEAAARLSAACVAVFQGNDSMRKVARDLDVVAYGSDLETRGREIGRVLVG